MCGIMGYTGPRNVTDVVIGGLECLEYRGYDSAGIALFDGRKVETTKCVGSVENLKEHLGKRPFSGKVGIGHTRWATHGGVTRENAHPHGDPEGKVVLIHNGIIENFHELKQSLQENLKENLRKNQKGSYPEKGLCLTSETDTEIAACLIGAFYEGDPLEALRNACALMRGSFAFVVLFTDIPDRFYCVRKGPPLVLGTASGEAFCASDATALLPYTKKLLFMEDDEIAVLSSDGIALYALEGTPRETRFSTVDWDASMTSKGLYPHFMLKEIEEQGSVLRRTLSGRLVGGKVDLSADFPFTGEDVGKYRRIQLVACGTSHYASLVAGRLMDRFTGLDVRAETASEYRYGHVGCDRETLAVFISQSGETADTLAAARLARSRGARCLAVTNAVNSSLAREVGAVLELRAGPEIGVAATKTFMGQLAALTLLALWIGGRRGRLGAGDERRLAEELLRLPMKIESVVAQGSSIRELAGRYAHAEGFLFIGRGASWYVGMEGALKLKEISYIHAEAHAAGEMKHGPIAMLDAGLPVVAVVPRDDLYEKTLSNIQEARARKAPVIAVTSGKDVSSEQGAASEEPEGACRFADDCIVVPATENELTPFLTVVPLQLFAYHLASLLGREIDRPRNLAKSVTVE